MNGAANSGVSQSEDGDPRGSLLDTETRRAQRQGGSDGCLGANLTELGVRIHDVEPGTNLRIQIFTDGIWIQPVGEVLNNGE